MHPDVLLTKLVIDLFAKLLTVSSSYFSTLLLRSSPLGWAAWQNRATWLEDEKSLHF